MFYDLLDEEISVVLVARGSGIDISMRAQPFSRRFLGVFPGVFRFSLWKSGRWGWTRS